jgi:hypothetical protein
MTQVNIVELEQQVREEEDVALDLFYRGLSEAPVLLRPAGYLTDDEPTEEVLKAIGDGSKPMVFVASEETPDRRGDTVAVAGWKLTAFRKNPVFMYAHNHSIPPIGKVVEIWIDEPKLMVTAQFDDEDGFAEAIHGKYLRRMMRGVSVGFKPLEWKDIGDQGGRLFTKQELVELSAVNVGMHPHALAKALASGPAETIPFLIIMPKELDKVDWTSATIQFITPPSAVKTVDPDPAPETDPEPEPVPEAEIEPKAVEDDPDTEAIPAGAKAQVADLLRQAAEILGKEEKAPDNKPEPEVDEDEEVGLQVVKLLKRLRED